MIQFFLQKYKSKEKFQILKKPLLLALLQFFLTKSLSFLALIIFQLKLNKPTIKNRKINTQLLKLFLTKFKHDMICVFAKKV